MRFSLEGLDRPTLERTFRVERDRIRAYSAATNETAQAFAAGDVAPPVFAILPVWETIHEATRLVVPEEARPHVVHGEQDMFLYKPLLPGSEVVASSAVVGVHPKPSGTTVIVKATTLDADRQLVSEQYVTEFYRGIVAEEGSGETAPDHRTPEELAAREPDATIAYRVDEDQTFRYAEASGDHFEIHLDDQAAKAVGLPGIIAHGLCVMAFAGRAVLEAAGAADLKRLAVRFSRPVRPGETVTTRIWRIGTGAFAFEAGNGEGEVVLRDGRAELRSPNLVF
jgi:acyl dehydratase